MTVQAAKSSNQALDDVGLVKKTVSAILALIRDGGLKVGDSLPNEGALANQFGVSRTVVREANRSLAALGVIEIMNGRPARVGLPSQDVLNILVGHAVQIQHATVQQVLDVRRTLEARTVVLAALRRTASESDEIVALARAIRRDYENPETSMGHDIAFHIAIARAARNPLLELLMGAFEQVTKLTWPVGWRARSTEEARMTILKIHEEIAEAIKKQDPERAEKAMARHFEDSVRTLVAAGVV
jgi:DNA-binding FadR family transcriptional regulator